jgi:hypothetical protein
MIEQWFIAMIAVFGAGCFWAGYWAKGTEGDAGPHDDTQNGVGDTL